MKRLLVMLAAASVLPACYCGPYDPFAYYDAAYYDPYYAASEAPYIFSTYDPYGLSLEALEAESSKRTLDLEAAAEVIAARAREAFTSDCVKATASGATVRLELENCESRFGGRDIDGQVGIVLSREGEQLRFEVSSSGLTIDDDLFVLGFTGTASSSGARRLVRFESRTRDTGRLDARTSTGTISWDRGNPCLTIDAQSTSTKDEVTIDSTLTGFQQCAGQCPSAGAVTVLSGRGEYSGTFDGSNTLRVFAPNGAERSFELRCK